MENEPEIIINGQRLTEAQSMTVRCAFNNFMVDLNSGYLGTDGHGKEINRLYKKRLQEVQNIILNK